jgi:hypothetical protein
MIELTLQELAAGVVGASLVVVCGAVWISRWSNANAERRGVRHRLVCRLCQHVWEDRSRERHPVCPACGAANARRRRPHAW